MLPLLDRRSVETPVAPDPKAGQATLAQKPVDRSRMNAQMLREFFYCKDFVL
jgi:hypothetical protein